MTSPVIDSRPGARHLLAHNMEGVMPDRSGMPFSDLMGVEVIERTKERVRGRLTVREDLCTAGGILHGGAYMAFADTLGAVGTVINMPADARTTTTDSSTKFVGAAPVGSTVIGEFDGIGFRC